MQGFQLSLFFQENQRHHHQLLADWIIAEARRLGIRGATVLRASEGYGRHGKLHCAHFFELTEQPVEVTLAVTEEELDRLTARLAAESVKVFFIKSPIEFGVLGE